MSERPEKIERALTGFVDYYTMGINPFLDETYRHARQALAMPVTDHRQDDDEPVTEEWLLSVGFAKSRFYLWVSFAEFTEDYFGELRVTPPNKNSDQDWYFRVEGGEPGHRTECVWLRHYNTRREVRDLCRVLGAKLKEGEQTR